KFSPISNIVRNQILKEFQTLKLEENGNLEEYLKTFQTVREKLQEQGITFEDAVYKSTLLLSLPDSYAIVVGIIESNEDMTTEMVENRLMKEWRKRKGELNSTTASLTSHGGKVGKGRKSGKPKSDLKCTHCDKKGHVENGCWTKNPELKPKRKRKKG